MTPQDQIALMIEQVQALVPDPLNNGQCNALLAKLQAAIQQLDNDYETPAANQLDAFINQVSAFISDGKLTVSQGQPLIDAAHAVIANWRVAGIDTERLDAARHIEFRVADIPGARVWEPDTLRNPKQRHF